MSFFSLNKSRPNTNNLSLDGNILIVISIALTAVLGVMSVNPILPAVAKSLNIPAQSVGLIMTSYLLPVAIGTPIFGVLADRLGRKNILVPSLLVFALGGILSAFAQDFRSLIEWRFLQGLGAASLEFLQLAAIADIYKGRMLPVAMGLNAAAIGLSATVYPMIGGGLAQLSWRYTFLLSAVAIPLALLVMFKLKLPQRQTKTKAVPLKIYLKNALKSISNRHVLGLMLAILALFFLEFGICFICVPIFANSLGASSATIGILLACMEISLALVAPQLGWLVQRFSEFSLIKFSFVISALSLSLVPLMNNVWFLFIPLILFGAAQGIAMPLIQTSLAQLAPKDYLAGFMSLNVTVQSLGRALGPIVAGIAFGVLGLRNVFYLGGGFALVTILLLNPFLKVGNREGIGSREQLRY
jgi:MFS family permease